MRPPLRNHSYRLSLHQLEDRLTPSGGGSSDDSLDDSSNQDSLDDSSFFDILDDSSSVIDDSASSSSSDDPFGDFDPIDQWDDSDFSKIDVSERFPLGSDDGGPPNAVIVSGDGTELLRVSAYDPSFLGGVRVATGDINGDGVPDLITVPGPGMPAQVKVFDGVSGGVIREFLAFEESFTGGAYVVSADLTGDGISEIILSPDEGGGPRVRVLNGSTLQPIQDFFGIDDPNFRGGCRVAVGDVNGDFSEDLIVSAGFGGGPRVAVFNGDSILARLPNRLLPDFFAFEDTLRNGAYPAVGDLNDDGYGDLVFGGGPGGGPRVLALDGYNALGGNFNSIGNFFAGDPNSRDGVQVGVGGGLNGGYQILATPRSGSSVSAYNLNGQSVSNYDSFRQSTGGATVGSASSSTITGTSSGRRTSDDAAFNHGAVVANFRGNYTSEYFTTIWDDKQNQEKRVRVEAVLQITSVTPLDPNSDPARNNGGNYRWTGTMVIRPASYLSMTVQVYGTYTCSQFPTTFNRQLGSTDLYTQGTSGYRTRPEVGATGSDTTTVGTISTNVFSFDKPGEYHTSPHTIVLKKVN